MKAQKVAGIIAAASGAALLILGLVAGVSGATSTLPSIPGNVGYPMGMGAPLTAGGTGMMGPSGMGPGTMGAYGMGPGMMGSGHMGFGGPAAPSTQSAAIPGAPEVRVGATEFALTPAEIVLPAGRAVNLTFANTGALPHDLTIPALGVRIVAAAGQTRTVGLRDLVAGTYPAYCGVSGHAAAGMRANVIVR